MSFRILKTWKKSSIYNDTVVTTDGVIMSTKIGISRKSLRLLRLFRIYDE